MKTISLQQLKDCYSLKEIDADCVYVIDFDGTKWLLTKQNSSDECAITNSKKMLVKRIASFAVQEHTISASAIQRKFKIGYAHACRILDYMEDSGYIGTSDGIEPRKVFITQAQIDEI